MSLKQNDLDILERKYSMYLILLVDKKPGLTKTDLMRAEEGNEKTKFRRISELIEAGIFEYRKDGDRTIKGIYLTPAGVDLTAKIKKLRMSVLKLNKNSDSETDEEE